MSIREALFAAALALAVSAVVIGVAGYSRPAAWVVGGVLGAVWSWLVLAGADE